MTIDKKLVGGLIGFGVPASVCFFFTGTAASAAIIFSGQTGVINIDSTVSGISLPNGQFAGSTLIAPLQVTFPAGSYSGSLTNPVLSPLSASYTAWTYDEFSVPSYLENFEAFNDNSGNPNTSAPVINFQNSSPPYLTALQAFADASGNTFTFTLPTTTTLDFVVPDNELFDNAGGVSVAISAVSVPEPVLMGLLLTGSTLLMRSRRKSYAPCPAGITR